MGKNNLYETSTPSISLYTGDSISTEANMRQELINMFDGKYPEISKSQPGLLRRIRLDGEGNKIECECVDSITKEPDKDRFCPLCYGLGWKWDEETIEFYKVIDTATFRAGNSIRKNISDIGLLNLPIVVFYIRYDAQITDYDRIVELNLELDGSASTPYVRKAIYKIESAWDYRSDNGKLEYWRILTHKEDYKYLNSPTYRNV